MGKMGPGVGDLEFEAWMFFLCGGNHEELANLFFHLILWSGVSERSDDSAFF